MELFTKYNIATATELENRPEYGTTIDEQLMIDSTHMLYDWAANHKTMICLNGGYLSSMRDILLHLNHTDNTYPWSTFYESDEAMGGMLTNIAMILPDHIYDTAAWCRSYKNELVTQDNDSYFYYPPESSHLPHANREFTHWEVELMNLLNKCGLAK